MTNKLVVIINSLKVPKNYENFTIWNEISCTKLQLPPEPLTRGLPPPDPHSLCPLSSTEFVDPPTPWTKFLGMPLVAGAWNLKSLKRHLRFYVVFCFILWKFILICSSENICSSGNYWGGVLKQFCFLLHPCLIDIIWLVQFTVHKLTCVRWATGNGRILSRVHNVCNATNCSSYILETMFWMYAVLQCSSTSHESWHLITVL